MVIVPVQVVLIYQQLYMYCLLLVYYAVVFTAGVGVDISGDDKRERWGLAFGLLAIAGFSVTLPATRLAVTYLDPVIVGLGRALVAAVCAATLLLFTRQRWPTRAQWLSLIVVALGVIIGFPWLSALALQELPAAHGAVVVAILPLLTAAWGALRLRQRPSWMFWLLNFLGSGLVLVFALSQGAGWTSADSLLVLASVSAAIGYTEGGRLARELGGWQVICWALLLAAPCLLWPVGTAVLEHGMDAPMSAWLAFAYVSLISQFVAFFFWYHGMALAGVVRVSQLQLLQPFMSLLVAAVLLGEPVSATMIGFALAVVATVALGRRMPIVQK